MSIEIIKATISCDCEREELQVIAIAPLRHRDAVEVRVAELNAEAKVAKSLHRYFTNLSSVEIINFAEDLRTRL